ncbi:hypothetical protein RAS1_18080 [Phycisphaerae bacterium RAS1]|nr:hypothetical protein RAS1_18080 [Phycisphaerae bacterium RAS1]
MAGRERALPYEGKHREAVYQQLCAQITREAIDLPSLTRCAAMALAHPEASRDPALAGMIRNFVAERENAIRFQDMEMKGGKQPGSKLRMAFGGPMPAPAEPTKAQLMTTLHKLEHDFDLRSLRFDYAGAMEIAARVQELRRRFPVHIDEATANAFADKIDELRTRCERWQQQITELGKQAASAAAGGEQEKATWILRRLHAIQVLHPALLPDSQIEAIRKTAATASATREQHEAVGAVLQREKQIADEINQLADVIIQFHRLEREHPRESPLVEAALARYKAAVRRVYAFDTEWLASLMVEMESLLDELHGDDRRAHGQVTRFIANVRSALLRLRQEIREIKAELGGGGATGPSEPRA